MPRLLVKKTVGASIVLSSQDLFVTIENLLSFMETNKEELISNTDFTEENLKSMQLLVQSHKALQDKLGTENDDIIDCGLYVAMKGMLLAIKGNGDSEIEKELKQEYKKFRNFQDSIALALNDLMKK